MGTISRLCSHKKEKRRVSRDVSLGARVRKERKSFYGWLGRVRYGVSRKS